MTRDAFLLDAVRTPVGRLRGILSQVRPDDLAGFTIRGLLERASLVSGRPFEALSGSIDEVILGCANQAGEDNRNVARMAALLARMPDSVPAVTVNRLCASGLEAAIQAARAVRLGDAELVVAGGVESMTRAPWSVMKPDAAFPGGALQSYDTALGWRYPNPRLAARFPLEGMGETAENVASRYAISRAAQDEFALRSHERALQAQEKGRFARELLAVPLHELAQAGGKKGEPRLADRDEGPRADTSLEKLGKLKAAFRDQGTVTAGNSSSLNDGAAALLIGSREAAEELGLSPLARIVASASAGVDPRYMGIGPVPATQRALARAGLSAKDLDLIELNEAFAAQSLAVIAELGLDPLRVNLDGGAIALGHPLGMSGARILGHLAHALRARGGGVGLATLCVGVGQGVSIIIQSVSER